MHVRRALALALVVPLVLAGCTEDEPEPKMPDPPTTSSTPTPTETETPEVESAAEFIRRWQEAALSAQNEGDTAEYRRLSRRCQSCLEFADQVDGIYEGGGSVTLDGLEVIRVTPHKSDDLRFTLVRRLGSTRVVDAEGQLEQELPGGRETLQVFLEQRRGSWGVLNVLRAER